MRWGREKEREVIPSKNVNEISHLYVLCVSMTNVYCLSYNIVVVVEDDMWILLKNSRLFSEERCFMTFAWEIINDFLKTFFFFFFRLRLRLHLELIFNFSSSSPSSSSSSFLIAFFFLPLKFAASGMRGRERERWRSIDKSL